MGLVVFLFDYIDQLFDGLVAILCHDLELAFLIYKFRYVSRKMRTRLDTYTKVGTNIEG